MGPDKVCQECGEDLRCVHTGCVVYLAHSGDLHNADLFMCFKCLTFHVFGLNTTTMSAWKVEQDGVVEVTIPPNVVVAGDYLLIPYRDDPQFAFVAFGTGDIVPLPASLLYMVEKCKHGNEIGAYLRKRKEERG